MADGMQKVWRELCVAVTIEALDKGERRWQHPFLPLTQSQRIVTLRESN
jgi:hypothetical protein